MQNATAGPATYRISNWDRRAIGPFAGRVHGQGTQLNEPVTGFDSLVHHPDNRGMRMVDGSIVGGGVDACSPMSASDRRSVPSRSGPVPRYGLATDQVLIKKDFICPIPTGIRARGRRVHVPAVAGVVGARRDREDWWTSSIGGAGGHRRIRLSDISRCRDAVEYGRTLGIK